MVNPNFLCRLKLKDVENCNLITIEGIALPDGTLHPVQQAFIDAGAIQCGFCTPGMVLTAYALLNKNPHPTRQQVTSYKRKSLSLHRLSTNY